jgi:hypothetical protein
LQLLAWRDAAFGALAHFSDCLPEGIDDDRADVAELPSGCAAARAALRSAVAPAVDADEPSTLNRHGRAAGPLVLLVAPDFSQWESAPALTTLLRRAGAHVLFYSSDGSLSGQTPPPLLDGLALLASADIVLASQQGSDIAAHLLMLRPGSTVLDIHPLVRAWGAHDCAVLLGVV